MKNYVKFTWVGNRITREDMATLYRMKQETKKPITVLVAEAIQYFLRDTGRT